LYKHLLLFVKNAKAGTLAGRLTGERRCLSSGRMPIYEYACAACGHQFEEWQKMSDKPVKTCPKCKAKKVEKQISMTSFKLKGGGWYSDLYAGPKPNGAKDSGASKDSTSKEASTASTSTTKSTKETKKSEAAA
jgi:putative FmdB family regulatory protein